MSGVGFLVFLLFSASRALDSATEVNPQSNSVIDDLDLPVEHAQIYLNQLSALSNRSSTEWSDAHLLRWGYELDSTTLPGVRRYSQPKCPGSHIGYVKDKSSQLSTFFSQADFGFIRQQMFELRVFCEPDFAHDSSLECSKNLRYCNGRNLYLDLRDVADRKEPIRYHMDVLKDGQIGGYCRMHRDQFKPELGHLSALQSWAPEMRFFQSLNRRPFPIDSGDAEPLCDVFVERPTVVMKLDASVNMYHHFCDFFNLYASLHVNSTGNARMYDRDINILIWETHTYRSAFGETFKAFTSNPLMDLTTFQGKRVCFRNLMFPLLPRMIFGLYYNTPIVSSIAYLSNERVMFSTVLPPPQVHGCHSSGLFRAFSQFILHRMRIPLHLPAEDDLPRVRITFLSRETKFRNVINEAELVEAIGMLEGVEVRRVAYSKEMQFRQQLEITRNTDVFIGMHGAGLTQLLFLPDWATLFELFNCGDSGCYKDLARLRGVNYMTWENATKVVAEQQEPHPDVGGAHQKFTNYRFDAAEFVRLVRKAVARVRENEQYRQFMGLKVDGEEEGVCQGKK